MTDTTLQNTQLNFILELICNNLQITERQYASAEEKYKAVGKWLSASDSQLRIYEPIIFSQGSFRIGTTVKPLARDEYDIDLVCQLQKDVEITDPMELLENVYQRIKSKAIYKPPISEKKNRCIRINYKGDFHLDILPAKPDPHAGTNCLLVPDKNSRSWKASNPAGYAEWFDNRARIPIKLLEKARVEPLPRYEKLSDKLPLQQTVQLLKRWRDIAFKDMEDSAPVSIVITTLAGRNYNKELLVAEALTNVLSGITQEAKGPGGLIIVMNPTNNKECLSEKWMENKKGYYAFVDKITKFKQEWNQLFAVRNMADLANRLEKMFGEKIVKLSIKKYGEGIEALRRNKKLGVDKKTGIITALSTASVPIKPNTFYGKKKV